MARHVTMEEHNRRALRASLGTLSAFIDVYGHSHLLKPEFQEAGEKLATAIEKFFQTIYPIYTNNTLSYSDETGEMLDCAFIFKHVGDDMNPEFVRFFEGDGEEEVEVAL